MSSSPISGGAGGAGGGSWASTEETVRNRAERRRVRLRSLTTDLMAGSSFPRLVLTLPSRSPPPFCDVRSIPGGERSSPGDDLPQFLGLAAGKRQGGPGLVPHDDPVGAPLLGDDDPDLREVHEVAPVDPEERRRELLLEVPQGALDQGPSLGGPRMHQLPLALEPEDLGRIEEEDLG